MIEQFNTGGIIKIYGRIRKTEQLVIMFTTDILGQRTCSYAVLCSLSKLLLMKTGLFSMEHNRLKGDLDRIDDHGLLPREGEPKTRGHSL